MVPWCARLQISTCIRSTIEKRKQLHRYKVYNGIYFVTCESISWTELIFNPFQNAHSVVRSGNDGNLCAVNPAFLAIVVDYAFVVIPISQTGRVDFQCNKVIGHCGQILDLKWNPFNDCIIASASDDCTVSSFLCSMFAEMIIPFNIEDFFHIDIEHYSIPIQIKIWRIPEEGLTANLDTFETELLGHRRKVLHIEWHPTTNNVMFSAGFDHTVSIYLHHQTVLCIFII